MKYADNYEGFIISGDDDDRGPCKTQNIMISGFNDDNGVELDGWQEEKIASTKYGFYTFELFLNIASEVEFGENTTIRLNGSIFS